MNANRIEHTDVATSIAGSAVISRVVRNKASRVALPPTNSAETTAAASAAISIERDVLVTSFQPFRGSAVLPVARSFPNASSDGNVRRSAVKSVLRVN